MGDAEISQDEFYCSKSVVRVEWWLHDCDLPDRLTWARVRVFSDGSADACFGEQATLYGFRDEDNAGYLLSEDEYVRLSSLDELDKKPYGVAWASPIPPRWSEQANQRFEYRGTHP